MRTIVLALAAIMAFSGLAQAQDAAAGKKVFRKCMACHKLGPKALKQRAVGPHLNGIFGRRAGSVEGYKYSKANKTSGITWTEEVFAQYIKNPRKYLKGTKMAFAGIKDDQDIKDLIAFLKQYKADGTMVK
jgi:cytochrome c